MNFRRNLGRRRVGIVVLTMSALLLGACTTTSSSTTTTSSDTGTDSSTAANTCAEGDSPAVAAATDKLYAQAKKETGTVVFYATTLQATNDNLQAEYNNCYPEGPRLQVVTVTSSVFATRYGSERQAGVVNADLIFIDLQSEKTFYESGWIQKSTSSLIPILAMYPEGYKAPYGTVAGIYPQIIMYNTASGKAPSGLKALMDPANQGKIGLADPRTLAASMAAMAVIRKQYGDAGLKKVAANKPLYFGGASEGVADLSSGQISLMYPAYGPNFDKAKTSGAPVGQVIPAEFSGSLNAIAISKGAQHPAAAALVANFALSAAGQAIINGNDQSSSGLPKPTSFQGLKSYTAPNPLPAGMETFSLDQLDALKPKILADLGLQ